MTLRLLLKYLLSIHGWSSPLLEGHFSSFLVSKNRCCVDCAILGFALQVSRLVQPGLDLLVSSGCCLLVSALCCFYFSELMHKMMHLASKAASLIVFASSIVVFWL